MVGFTPITISTGSWAERYSDPQRCSQSNACCSSGPGYLDQRWAWFFKGRFANSWVKKILHRSFCASKVYGLKIKKKIPRDFRPDLDTTCHMIC